MKNFELITNFDSDLGLTFWQARLKNERDELLAEANGVLIYNIDDVCFDDLFVSLDDESEDYGILGSYLHSHSHKFYLGPMLLFLDRIESKQAKQGHGSVLMEKILNVFNQPSVILSAKSWRPEDAKYAKKLKNWYKSFDFEELPFGGKKQNLMGRAVWRKDRTARDHS